jgi:hypothetical protein
MDTGAKSSFAAICFEGRMISAIVKHESVIQEPFALLNTLTILSNQEISIHG